MPDLITAAVHKVTADNAARTISGTVVLYGITANASSGLSLIHI